MRTHADTEGQLIEAKLQWANLDMENDELSVQVRHKNDKIKVYQMRITSLEIELARARDQIVNNSSGSMDQTNDNPPQRNQTEQKKQPNKLN